MHHPYFQFTNGGSTPDTIVALGARNPWRKNRREELDIEQENEDLVQMLTTFMNAIARD